MKHAPAPDSPVSQDFIDSVLARQAGRPGALLAILQQVQNNHPRKVSAASRRWTTSQPEQRFPLSRIYSVATFFALFNLQPQGRNTVSVCRGTACHTRGSRDLFENLMMKFGFQSSSDGETEQLSLTTPDGGTTLRTVACFGQCALAPVIEFNHAIFGHMNEAHVAARTGSAGSAGAEAMTPIRDEAAFNAVRDAGLAKFLPARPRIAVGMGTCGAGNGAEGVYHAFADAIGQRGLDVQLVQTGCFGFCAEEPLVNVWRPGQPLHHAASRAGPITSARSSMA